LTSRPNHLVWHGSDPRVDALRGSLLRQRGVTAWLTGLSGAGKSTISAHAEHRLLEAGVAAVRLDGDNLRHGLNSGCGFDASGRAEAVRRAGEAAVLLSGAGLVTLVGMISPYRADRERVRARHAEAGVAFLEVFVDVPLAVAEARDPKGLYARARAGELRGFTGVDDPYEPPTAPEIRLATDVDGTETCVDSLVESILAVARRD
jgi:bifunctional enzyme CysN/CysC